MCTTPRSKHPRVLRGICSRSIHILSKLMLRMFLFGSNSHIQQVTLITQRINTFTPYCRVALPFLQGLLLCYSTTKNHHELNHHADAYTLKKKTKPEF